MAVTLRVSLCHQFAVELGRWRAGRHTLGSPYVAGVVSRARINGNNANPGNASAAVNR